MRSPMNFFWEVGEVHEAVWNHRKREEPRAALVRETSELDGTHNREKGKGGKLGRKPGRKEKEKERGSGGSREFGSNKRGSGESRGKKRANQRYNRRFFGVLPETRSTGETTRTKTDGSLSSEISDSGNERTNKGNRG